MNRLRRRAFGLCYRIAGFACARCRARVGGGQVGSLELLEYVSLIGSEELSLLEFFFGAALVAEDGSPSALSMRDLLVGGRSIRASTKCSDQGMYSR